MAKKKTFLDNPALNFISVPEAEPTAAPSRSAAPEGYKLNPLYIEKRTKRIQLVIQPSLYEKAKAAADKRGISFNEFINQAIEATIKED